MVKSKLMEAVPLDPGDYGGTYKANAGRMSLDFVNTVSWPGTDRGHDWLDRPSNVVAWAVAVGALTDEEAEAIVASFATDPAHATRSLRRVHALRTDLADVLTPLAHGERPDGCGDREAEHAAGADGVASDRRPERSRMDVATASRTRRHCRRPRARRGRHRHEHRPFAPRALRRVRLAVPRHYEESQSPLV